MDADCDTESVCAAWERCGVSLCLPPCSSRLAQLVVYYCQWSLEGFPFVI